MGSQTQFKTAQEMNGKRMLIHAKLKKSTERKYSITFTPSGMPTLFKIGKTPLYLGPYDVQLESDLETEVRVQAECVVLEASFYSPFTNLHYETVEAYYEDDEVQQALRNYENSQPAWRLMVANNPESLELRMRCQFIRKDVNEEVVFTKLVKNPKKRTKLIELVQDVGFKDGYFETSAEAHARYADRSNTPGRLVFLRKVSNDYHTTQAEFELLTGYLRSAGILEDEHASTVRRIEACGLSLASLSYSPDQLTTNNIQRVYEMGWFAADPDLA